MTENSDAVVLIVSEETGIISIAHNGEIKRNYTVDSAIEIIKEKLVLENHSNKEGMFKKIFKKLFLNNENKEDIKEKSDNEN